MSTVPAFSKRLKDAAKDGGVSYVELLIKVGILFTIFLILSRLTLLSRRIRNSALFWHLIDYLWLGAAAVGLAFATIDVHKFGLNITLEEKGLSLLGN